MRGAIPGETQNRSNRRKGGDFLAENQKPHGAGLLAALPTGVLIRGTIISSIAIVDPKKDRTGVFVRVQHELALIPGVAVWEEYIDPSEDNRVDIHGDEVKKFPSLPRMSDILLKVGRFREFNRMLYVSNAEPIG